VALVDIGGGTTDIAIYSDGGVVHTGALTVAGNHITNDLALGLRAPFEVAEEVKRTAGSAFAAEIDPADAIEVKTFDADEGELVSLRLVAEIIESRTQEILGLVRAEIRKAGFDRRLPAGVVLVGGTAELRDIRPVAREVLDLPVRIGAPRGATGLTDTITRPAYATSIGLLLWAAYHTDEIPQSALVLPEWRGVGRLKGWFREFLT
jgi:cell division protein FtsA